MKPPFSFETFLKILEQDDTYSIDETSFYFEDDPNEEEHMLGCLRDYDKPYWIGYCDIPDGAEYYTALELLTAKIFDGRSIQDRWDHIVFCNIGMLDAETWLDIYGDKF